MRKAAIIGAGSIGAMKPDEFDFPGGERVLTIAHAMFDSPEVHLSHIIDTDLEKAKAAAVKWECSFSTKLPESERFDIIAVCTPTSTHYDVLKSILKLPYAPKVVIAEKPFCETSEQAEEIVKAFSRLGIILIIDYIRRFDVGHQSVGYMIKSNPKIYHAKLTYTRGLVHEACHAVDLFCSWFGKLESIQTFPNSAIYDRDRADPAIGVVASFERCPFVVMCPVDGRDYAAFEIEVFMRGFKIVLTDHGQELQLFKTQKDSYGNYKCIGARPTEIHKTSLPKALSGLIANAVECTDGLGTSLCDGDDAIEVQKIYEKL